LNDNDRLPGPSWSFSTRENLNGLWIAVGAHADGRSIVASGVSQSVALLKCRSIAHGLNAK
jgi:hypothetical protein